MSQHVMDPAAKPHYGTEQKKKSRHLLYIIAFLGLLITTVFFGLYLFGQRFGVPV